MKDVVNELENENKFDKNRLLCYYIDEKSYQQIKKEMCKTNDYFSKKELEKIDVILT